MRPMYPFAEHSIPISTYLKSIKVGVSNDSISDSAAVDRKSILFPAIIIGTFSLILTILGSHIVRMFLIESWFVRSYTRTMTLAFSISLSVCYSWDLLELESTRIVLLLFGSK
jgi:putative Mn2+ efflux pump MntP